MRNSRKVLRSGSKVTNFAIVAALHVGIALAFIGCAKPAARMVEQSSEPVVVEMILPPPPPAMVSEMIAPMERSYAAAPSYHAESVMSAPPDTNKFPDQAPNSTVMVDEKPVSTFSVDVDTASYAFVRRVLTLIDVSGSMAPEDRLPLLQKGFRMFAAQLRDMDRVAIVTYADGTRVLLEPTSGKDKQKIIAAIDSLGAGGGTAGGEGLGRAYVMAARNFDPKAINRVILATDGDFNIGISDPKQLEKFIAARRKSGVYLSIFGVGVGNLNDALMQRLSQAGNGNAAYIDTVLEARKAMSEELGSTMFPIANDVKVQVEFNPKLVAAYRLIGYETRMLERQAIEHVVHAASSRPSMAAVPDEQRFAVAVAAFAQRLRDEKDIGDFSYAEIAKLANSGRGADPQGYRAVFVKLVHAADTLNHAVPMGQRRKGWV